MQVFSLMLSTRTRIQPIEYPIGREEEFERHVHIVRPGFPGMPDRALASRKEAELSQAGRKCIIGPLHVAPSELSSILADLRECTRRESEASSAQLRTQAEELGK